MIEIPDEQYVDYVQLRRQRDAPKQKRGILRRIWDAVVKTVFGVFILLLCAAFFLLILDRLRFIPPTIVDRAVGTPQTSFQTRQGGAGGARQQPTITPGLTPFYGAPGETNQGAGGEEESTATPAPTADTQLTAIAIKFAPTETAQAAEWEGLAADGHRYFYDPYTLATPEPGFGGYVEGQCSDEEKVKASFLLQQMCGGGE